MLQLLLFLGDPGVNHKVLEDQIVDEILYRVIKVTYDAKMGDTPKDNYVLYVDPQTNKLDFLLYTITFNEKAGKNYRAYKYKWQNINGLLLQSEGIPYNSWDDEKKYWVKQIQIEVLFFKNIQLDKGSPSIDIFKKPNDAKVLPLQ